VEEGQGLAKFPKAIKSSIVKGDKWQKIERFMNRMKFRKH
jgi:hypothetical protein